MKTKVLNQKRFGYTGNKTAALIVVAAFIFYLTPSIMGTQGLRQRLLQAAYPVLMRFTKAAGKNAMVLHNRQMKAPVQPFYHLGITLNNGLQQPMEQFKGQKILIVNTASDCGYTNQYEELQQLWERHKGTLQIIGFPANDFKEQERGSDAEIAQFCKINYGVNFPLAQKSSVAKGPGQHPVFAWLSNAKKNGWNDHAPDWNFSKYLVSEQGVLTHYFGPSISPLDSVVTQAVKE